MKLAVRICQAIGVLLVVFIVVFTEYIDNHRPDHAVGRFVIQSENHGQRVFISQADSSITTGAWVAFFVILVVAIALEGLRHKDH